MEEIKMPSNCVACTAEETEYDGCGFDWQKFGEIAGIVAGCAIMIASATFAFKKGFTQMSPAGVVNHNSSMNGFGGAMTGLFMVGAVGTVASIGCLAAHKMDKL